MPYSLPNLENNSVQTALASSGPLLLRPRAPMEEVHMVDFSKCGSTNSYDQGILDHSCDKTRMAYINHAGYRLYKCNSVVVCGWTTTKRVNNFFAGNELSRLRKLIVFLFVMDFLSSRSAIPPYHGGRNSMKVNYGIVFWHHPIRESGCNREPTVAAQASGVRVAQSS